MPAAAHTEKDGTFTNTQRLLQWHHKAVEPPGDCRSELWFMYHLGRRIREKLAGSTAPRTGRCSTSPGTTRPRADRRARRRGGAAGDQRLGRRRHAAVGLHRAEGRRLDRLRLLDLLRRATPTGSTRRRAASPAPSRAGSRPEWGWAWPANRRILYNRASADPEGRPVVGAQALRVVGRGAGPLDRPRRAGLQGGPPPGLRARPTDAQAEDALRGDDPFIMQADGKRLAVRADRPGRRAAAHALRAARVAGRATRSTARARTRPTGASAPGQPLQPPRRGRGAASSRTC